ncbi:MAG: T9SS type A sorting domain-containing protein [Candidatus Neomarinimicrobiota bacterium]
MVSFELETRVGIKVIFSDTGLIHIYFSRRSPTVFRIQCPFGRVGSPRFQRDSVPPTSGSPIRGTITIGRTRSLSRQSGANVGKSYPRHKTSLSFEKGALIRLLSCLPYPYPNPFNPGSTLRYDLPRITDVSLVVYDLLGRELVRLVDSRLGSGYHWAIWNGRTADGDQASAGIYIARLTTPQHYPDSYIRFLKQISIF